MDRANICSPGHICFSSPPLPMCIFNKSCDECTFQFIHCGIRKWIICPVADNNTHNPSPHPPTFILQPNVLDVVISARRSVVCPLNAYKSMARTCCRSIQQSIHNLAQRRLLESNLAVDCGVLQLRFMVQFTITLKIQLSFCSTFAKVVLLAATRTNRPASSEGALDESVESPSSSYLSARSNNLLTFRPLINSFSSHPTARIHLHITAGGGGRRRLQQWAGKFCPNLFAAIQFVLQLYKRFMALNFLPSTTIIPGKVRGWLPKSIKINII